MRNAFVLAFVLVVSVTPLLLPSAEAGRLLLQQGGYPGSAGPGVGGSPSTPYVPRYPTPYQQPPGTPYVPRNPPYVPGTPYAPRNPTPYRQSPGTPYMPGTPYVPGIPNPQYQQPPCTRLRPCPP